MLRIYDCITLQHDLGFVLAAGLLCLLSCYVAVGLLARGRLVEGRSRHAWITAAAVVAGAGIWATHFVAMLAYHYDVPARYDVNLTLLSIAIAMVITWCGFMVALGGHRWLVPLGGLVAGLAVASMHYVGMFAVQLPAEPVWDQSYVIASIAVGAVFIMSALWAISHPHDCASRRAGGAILYALGIIGLHFTAMAAVTYVPDPLSTISDELVNRDWLSIAITAVTVLIIGLGFMGTVFDQHLTGRLSRHVEELETTQRELEQTAANLHEALDAAAAGSQAKSQFLASMSHELRTPLNAVIGFSEILENEIYGPLGDTRYRDCGKTIRESGAHLLSLIEDVLDISKLDAGALKLNEDVADLRHLVERAVTMVRQQADNARISLTAALPVDLPRVRVDERRIRQVLLNLLSNAIKFTEPGGSIRITGHRVGDGIAVRVEYTGMGIAGENIPRAFERFAQIDGNLDRRFEGTGLGLPLSRDLMEMHGGTLGLESTEGVGTIVNMVIPESRLVEELGPAETPAGLAASA